MTRRDLNSAPLIEAARGRTPSRTPVWFMRQAGRSLPEYRKVREGIPMLESCFMPELLAEITLQPVRRHDVDAAILFSDIVVPLKAAGVDVEIVPGRGPVVGEPVRTKADVAKLDRRIRLAVRAVCGEASDADLQGKNEVRRCRQATLAHVTARRDGLVADARPTTVASADRR